MKGVYETNRTSPHNPIGTEQYPVIKAKDDGLNFPDKFKEKNQRFAYNPRHFNQSFENKAMENVMDLFRKENQSMYYGT